jgi:hypothetical protein
VKPSLKSAISTNEENHEIKGTLQVPFAALGYAAKDQYDTFDFAVKVNMTESCVRA